MNQTVLDTYLTVQGDTPVELFKDKGSKFYCYVYHIENPEQVRPIIQTLKEEHYSARHHCYAYRIGELTTTYRVNDDGEPSGTAGVPIYNQIQSFGLTNVLVVVVRYFGGTLLGVPGLINAYKSATQMGLQSSTVVEKIVCKDMTAHFDYAQMSSVMRIVKDFDLSVSSQDFQAKCRLYFSVRLSAVERVKTAFEELYLVRLECD